MPDTEPQDAEAHRRAVLAAVLAVKRGLISPEDAINMVGGVLETAAPGTAQSGPPASSDPLDTLARVNPQAATQALTLELDDLMRKGGSALAGLGLSIEQQEALNSLQSGRQSGMDGARKVLVELARKRVAEIRGRLPLTSAARYEIQREFARGGMGRILIATDTAVGREVALKEVLVPHERPGSDPSDANPEAVERFLREAKVTGQLEHPNIVPVYEISRRDDGSIFYTMKLVRGRSMAERLLEIQSSEQGEAAKLAERLKLLEAFLDVCHAIAYAHSRGVIHRDLKPQNIMLGNFGETVVLDWGLARVRDEEIKQTVSPETPRFSQTLMKQARESHTLDGSVIGTPAYMPPEQARGLLELVDDKSDVYSLGAILYEILAGKPPYEGISAETIVSMVLDTQPRPLAECSPLAPPDLVSLAEKAMARDRDKRLESAQALAHEVAAFRDGRPLSVYEYSSMEMLRRFVGRHKAAVAVASLALAVLATVIVWSVVNISSERDAAKESLALANTEKADRLALEARQKQEREGLIRQRQDQITRQRGALDALDPKAATELAKQALEELRASTPEKRKNHLDATRQQISAMAARVLDVAAARAELVRLAAEPVAGRQEALMTTAELASQESALLDERLLAASVAAVNEDFALADLILDGTRGPAARLETARNELEAARTALLRQHADRIGAILTAVRAGKDIAGSPVDTNRVRDHVGEVSAWREPQTVELLTAALRPLTDAARANAANTVWDVRQRLEIQFIGEVLVLTGSPALAVPPLAELMLALSDETLVIRLAVTLCRLEHASAWAPLARLREKAGPESLVWLRVRRHFKRVPEPADLPPPEGANECWTRARLRLDQGRSAEAVPLLRNAADENPAHQDALLALSRVTWDLRTDGDTGPSLELVDRLLAASPTHARGLAWKARLIMYGMLPEAEDKLRNEKVLDLLNRAVAAGPDDWYVLVARAQYLGSEAGFDSPTPIDAEGALKDATRAIELQPRLPEPYQTRAALHGDAKRNAEALADINRAIDLDPESHQLWMTRGGVHNGLAQYEAAARDFTQAIELMPMSIWPYMNRASARLKLKDYPGALGDANFVIGTEGDTYPPAFYLRGRVRKASGDRQGAIADLKYYISLRPDFPDVPRVKKEIEELEQGK